MYTEKDCEPCDGSQCLIDRVVVLRQEEKSGQIFLCLGGEGSGILAERGALRLICLENGERHIGWRENMLGILRPELLGEKERLHLSQICPGGRKPEGNGRYWGYCFFRGWQIVGWGCLKKYGGSAPICTDAEKIPVPDQNL